MAITMADEQDKTARENAWSYSRARDVSYRQHKGRVIDPVCRSEDDDEC